MGFILNETPAFLNKSWEQYGELGAFLAAYSVAVAFLSQLNSYLKFF